MNRRICTTLGSSAVGLALAVGAVVAAAPASAHHSTAAEIINSGFSTLPIRVDNECTNRTLGSSTVLLHPGTSTQGYDEGFKITPGYVFSAWRDGVLWYSNVVSDGKAYCIGNNEWLILVKQFWN